MAEINASIPLGVQGPMQSIGGFLDVAKSMTALKAAQVGLESNQKILEERNKVRDLFQDPTKFMGEDGNFDYNKVVGPIMEAAPTTGGDIITKLFQGQREASIAKQSILQLGDAQRASVGQWLLSQSQDPKATKESVDEGLGHLTALMPTLKPAVEFFRKSILANASDPESLKAGLMQAGRTVMSPTQQEAAARPGSPFSQYSQEKPSADVLGNPTTDTYGPTGTVTRGPARIAGAAPGSSTPPPMFSYPAGESQQSAQTLAGERQTALATLRDAPIMHQNTRGILENIDKTTTGSSGPVWARINSVMGGIIPSSVDVTSTEGKASAYDLVGKFLERNALQAAQAMGPHTNAGLESQIKAQGSVAYNPTAIKKIAKLNDAIVSGAEQYQPGLEKAITSSPNQIFAKREYDQAWAQNFDVRIMELYNAQKAGDKEAIAEIVKGLGPNGVKDIQRKAINLETLSTQGRL